MVGLAHPNLHLHLHLQVCEEITKKMSKDRKKKMLKKMDKKRALDEEENASDTAPLTPNTHLAHLTLASTRPPLTEANASLLLMVKKGRSKEVTLGKLMDTYGKVLNKRNMKLELESACIGELKSCSTETNKQTNIA